MTSVAQSHHKSSIITSSKAIFEETKSKGSEDPQSRHTERNFSFIIASEHLYITLNEQNNLH